MRPVVALAVAMTMAGAEIPVERRVSDLGGELARTSRKVDAAVAHLTAVREAAEESKVAAAGNPSVAAASKRLQVQALIEADQALGDYLGTLGEFKNEALRRGLSLNDIGADGQKLLKNFELWVESLRVKEVADGNGQPRSASISALEDQIGSQEAQLRAKLDFDTSRRVLAEFLTTADRLLEENRATRRAVREAIGEIGFGEGAEALRARAAEVTKMPGLNQPPDLRRLQDQLRGIERQMKEGD